MERKWKKGRLGFFVILCSMVLSFCFGFSSLAAREKEDNGSFERANQITVGTTVTGSISSRGDEDFFKFTIKKKGKIRFQIKNYDLGFLEVSMCLYDQNKRNIFEGGTADSIIEKSISVSPGVYYLRVIQWGLNDQGSFPYSFKINFSEGKGNCQEQENFASFQSAKKISIESGVYGTISRQGSCAYYKFTLPQDGVVYFTGARTVSGDDYGYWQTSLYNAKKQKIDSFYYNSHYGRRRVGLSAGTYYIKIMRTSKWSKNRYYFKLDYKRSDKWEKELNDTPDKSTRIRLNSYVYGSENSLNDIDYYNFTMAKNGKIKFDFHGEDECYAVLYDSSHKQVNAKTLHYTEGLADSLSNRAPISLKKGKYYLKICHNYLAWETVRKLE